MPGTTPRARALSIRQPWAALILAGHKPVENRTWSTGYRGPLIVHAGTRPDAVALPLAHAFGIPTAPTGCYLGVVELTDVHHADRCGGCPWGEPGRWHWVLHRPRRFPTPIPGPGRLGLYTPPATITTAQEAAR